MANGPKPIRPITLITGTAAVLLLLFLTIGTVTAVWVYAPSTGVALGPSDLSAIRFTLTQAFVSACLSILFAIPVARALARRSFLGRKLFVTLLGAPFILPSIVAVLGIVAVWGRSGYFNTLLGVAGFETFTIYGFWGVVLAHIFFNLPLSTRFILQAWLTVPSEHFRLASQLGFSNSCVFRQIEWPLLRRVIPSTFLIIFLLCISSFAVALALGGGPKATTIELAIYQALRFDFNLPKAALLAMIQFGFCTVGAVALLALQKDRNFSIGLSRTVTRWDGQDRSTRLLDYSVLWAAGLFLLLPLLSIFIRGVPGLINLPMQALTSAITSLSVALTSTVLTIALAMALAAAATDLSKRHKSASRLVEAIGLLTLAASPFVIGTGLFILINPIADPFALSLPITAVVNAAMALPFALRVIVTAMSDAEAHYGNLADNLNLTGCSRFKLAIWPRIKRSVGFAAGLAAALSMGDLGVIALFAAPDTATLPLTMYRLMSAYQTEAAASAALILVSLSMALFWIFDQGGRIEHHV